tara:strand:+ start:1635 stop:2405 length:771 start_codon:yes stop_codon:yes gene_type:complete
MLKKIFVASSFISLFFLGNACSEKKEKHELDSTVFKYEFISTEGPVYLAFSDVPNEMLDFCTHIEQEKNGVLKVISVFEDIKTVISTPMEDGYAEGVSEILIESIPEKKNSKKDFARIIVNYQKGQREGFTNGYVNDKDLCFQGHYSNDLPEGEWIFFYNNKTPGVTLYFKEGQIVGKASFFKEDGSILAEGTFTKEGHQDGVCIYPIDTFYQKLYNPGSRKVSVVKLKDGKNVYDKEYFFIDLIEGKIDPEWDNY